MKKLPQLPSINECFSCGLCEYICPKRAIHMEENSWGFMRPVVDPDNCIGCRACEKTCQKLHYSKPEPETVSCFESWNMDLSARLESSSGGLMTALGERTLDQGGVVIGVAWQNRSSAAYVVVDDKANLDKIQKSKYLQANPMRIISTIRDYLNEGRQVLYTGLPCHARAIRQVFGYKRDELLILDIACYGVPSCNLIKSFIRSKESQNDPVVRYECRHKGSGWRSYSACLYYRSGKKEIIPSAVNPFQNAFICSGLAYNDSCYDCSLNAPNRFSDISIGDYWGRRTHDEGDKLGVSSVISLTRKGEKVLKELQAKKKIHLAEIELEDLMRGNGGFLKAPRRKHPMRALFLEKLAHQAWEKVLPKYLNRYYCTLPYFYVGCKLVIIPRYIELIWLQPRRFIGQLLRLIMAKSHRRAN